MKDEFTLGDSPIKITEECYHHNSRVKLPVVNWLHDIPESELETDIVEVQFKNTRKGYFLNSAHLPLSKGTVVVVEANPGYDIGEVTLVGTLVLKQIKKYRLDMSRYVLRNVLRLATETDIRCAEQAHAKEQETMIEARKIAKQLELEMKVGDVEYQGDGTKAIFYYIADGRVNFRQLIRVYAETFHIRIEMRQIGARQEAGRLGGTGACGRELCCSTWMTDFTSVVTDAIRLQNLPLNAQKMTGQCAKLKCCYNYEVPIYEDAMKNMPPKNKVLRTQQGDYFFFVCSPLQDEITYSMKPNAPENLQIISAKHAKEIIALNEQGTIPANLGGRDATLPVAEVGYSSNDGQGDISRFDKKKRPKNKNNKNPKNAQNRPNKPNNQENK